MKKCNVKIKIKGTEDNTHTKLKGFGSAHFIGDTYLASLRDLLKENGYDIYSIIVISDIIDLDILEEEIKKYRKHFKEKEK